MVNSVFERTSASDFLFGRLVGVSRSVKDLVLDIQWFIEVLHRLRSWENVDGAAWLELVARGAGWEGDKVAGLQGDKMAGWRGRGPREARGRLRSEDGGSEGGSQRSADADLKLV